MEANETRRVLVLEDSPMVRRVIAEEIALWAGGRGIEVVEDATGEALRTYRSGRFSLLVLDGDIPGIRPLGFLRNLRKRGDELPAIVMSCGAPRKNGSPPLPGVHVLRKPFGFTEMKRALAMALPSWEKRERSRVDAGSARYPTWTLLGKSPKIVSVSDLSRRVAGADAALLLVGPSGSGKTTLAELIHGLSPRRKGPFIEISSGALPETLIESELFGHEKGAFTGADSLKRGKFELAFGGTLFLDDVANLSLAVQAKLLRVLQKKAFERVGGAETLHADVRVIAATSENLKEWVQRGKFRRDLYWRLNVITIELPALADRREDVPILVGAFLKKFAELYRKGPLSVPKPLLEALLAYPWPGNVRELENAVERLVVLAGGSALKIEDLPQEFEGSKGTGFSDSGSGQEATARDSWREMKGP